jgi:hypothetical protein
MFLTSLTVFSESEPNIFGGGEKTIADTELLALEFTPSLVRLEAMSNLNSQSSKLTSEKAISRWETAKAPPSPGNPLRPSFSRCATPGKIQPLAMDISI